MTAYDLASLAPAIAQAQTALAACEAARVEGESAWQHQRLQLAERTKRETASLRADLARLDPGAVAAEATAAEQARWRRRLEAVVNAASRLRREVRERLEQRLTSQRAAELAKARELMAQNAGQRSEVLRGLASQRQRAQTLVSDIHRGAARIGVALPAIEAAALPEVPLGTDAGRAVAGLTAQLDQLAAMLPGLVGGWRALICRTPGRIVLPLLALLPPIGLAVALPGWAIAPWVAGLAVVMQLAVFGLRAQQRAGLGERFAFMRDSLDAAAARAAAIERMAADPAAAARRSGGIDAMVGGGIANEEAQRAARGDSDKALASIRDREARLRARIERVMAPRATAAGRAAQAAMGGRQRSASTTLAAAEAAGAAAVAAADGAWQARRAELDTARGEAAATLTTLAGEANAQADSEHPPWSSPAWAAWTPGSAWPTGLPLGSATSPDGSLTVPVALPYPNAAGLLVRSGPERRAAALDMLGQAALRCLLATPPGRVKLTLIDPIGLGQGFAPLLALADHGESVLAGGLASDGERIERALDDLCAHLEVVIRSRLRGTYETLADYNREAGELQEPIRLVAIADFPAGFGERASERLAVLLRTGARCGVHILLHHDVRQRLAPALDTALTQHATLVVREADQRLIADHPILQGWSFVPAALVPATLASRLAGVVGAAAVRASKVEIAFRVVAPAAAEVWSQSTAERLRVPVGVRGAGQLQYLELGRGTAQHVLIGGRTGSGKSTLLHVLVTSAALWFHPRELEVHLIDFKKGVEFQAYAATKLPHARVVAIESDREFGLSVLRRLDGELTRRGELFRTAGAQDLAAHRRSGGEHLPRILLLIDEFQEFFTEDDTVARDAALLLDRFVRQGRAFGVHVVLGSQTLSGSYSLAKSSLGQMGVRIVLPCNEADAHLLLHEDNDATRLLTRPGEAIYNDQAGMSEGNSPFQVCWLSDQQRSDALRPLAARAAAEGWKAGSPTVIFAGDAPARLDEDLGIAARLTAAPDGKAIASIGQSSSLRGSAEVVFPAASGGNLLLVGQHREAAVATLVALGLGLALRCPLGGLRLVAFDGEDPDGPFALAWAAMAAAVPHGAVRIGGRELAATLDELSELLARRQSGEDPSRTPVLLVVNALQRLRTLRPDDDAPFDRTGEPLSDRFAKLLANGPEYGLFAAVWCDALSGVQRSLSRKSLRDFDLRICFQMSPADSNELIDDDAASRLGLHSALLAVLAEGRREKFRPYQAPDPAFLARVGAALRAR